MSRRLPFLLCALLASTSLAAAEDLPPNPPPPPPANSSSDTSKIEFETGGDVTSLQGLSGYLRGTIAPQGTLDQSGLRLRLATEGDIYTYPGPNGFDDQDHEIQGDAQTGYRWSGQKLSVLGLVGINAQDHTLTTPDPKNVVQGGRLGAKVTLEVTANPTDKIQLDGYGSYSTAFNTYEVDLRPGVLVAQHVYLGPQFVFSGDAQYSEWRTGAQVSGLKFGSIETFLAAGLVHDSLMGYGAYGTMEANVRF